MEEKGVIFVLVKDGKILMQQRDKNCRFFPFMWCIPGGHKEIGESYEEALSREIKEEYNLDIKKEDCKYFMDYENEGNKVYICEIHGNQVPVLCEGMDMRWMKIEEIKNIKLGFNQDSLIPLLEKYLKNNYYEIGF